MIALRPKLSDDARESLLALGSKAQITDARVAGGELAVDETEVFDPADKLRHGTLTEHQRLTQAGHRHPGRLIAFGLDHEQQLVALRRQSMRP